MKIIRTSKSPYVIFGGMAVFFMLMPLHIVVFDRERLLFAVELIIAISSVFFPVLVYLFSQKVELSNDSISYKKWFFVQKKIMFNDVQGWNTLIGVFKYRDRLKPTVRLEIYPKVGTGSDQLIIPIKLFSKKDFDEILRLLPEGKRIKR